MSSSDKKVPGLSNISKMVQLSEPNWNEAQEDGLLELVVEHIDGKLKTSDSSFINMCSCSYLGLDTNPEILNGAIEGIKEAGTLHLTTARVRLYLKLLDRLENQLSKHFDCHAMSFNSCSSATAAFLPLLSAGLFTDNKKPTIVVDKHAHFSIKYILPLCSYETEVIQAPHNNMNFLEDICKKRELVAYICDGTYSMGGHAPFDQLKEIQKKYNTFLYIDDSHGLSICHPKGWGLARSQFTEMSDKTVIVASLAKAFGAAGGVLMTQIPNIRQTLARHGNAWSQYLNSAGIGGCLTSLKIHNSPLLTELQNKLYKNLEIIDKKLELETPKELTTIRVIPIGTEAEAARTAKKIFDEGFYTSVVFFPIVAKGTAGLRIMGRSDVEESELNKFCNIVNKMR